MSIKFILLLTFLGWNTSFGFQEKVNIDYDSVIEWARKRPLVKNDFKGIRPEESGLTEALSFIFISIDVKPGNTGKYKCDFRAYFRPSISWSIPNMYDSLLLHEQIHFDMCELIARKLRLFFRDGVSPSELSKVNDKYDSMIAELMEMSNLYDIETFGIYYLAQVKWKKKIDEELEGLRNYELKDGIELYRLKGVQPINGKPK